MNKKISLILVFFVCALVLLPSHGSFFPNNGVSGCFRRMHVPEIDLDSAKNVKDTESFVKDIKVISFLTGKSDEEVFRAMLSVRSPERKYAPHLSYTEFHALLDSLGRKTRDDDDLNVDYYYYKASLWIYEFRQSEIDFSALADFLSEKRDDDFIRAVQALRISGISNQELMNEVIPFCISQLSDKFGSDLISKFTPKLTEILSRFFTWSERSHIALLFETVFENCARGEGENGARVYDENVIEDMLSKTLDFMESVRDFISPVSISASIARMISSGVNWYDIKSILRIMQNISGIWSDIEDKDTYILLMELLPKLKIKEEYKASMTERLAAEMASCKGDLSAENKLFSFACDLFQSFEGYTWESTSFLSSYSSKNNAMVERWSEILKQAKLLIDNNIPIPNPGVWDTVIKLEEEIKRQVRIASLEEKNRLEIAGRVTDGFFTILKEQFSEGTTPEGIFAILLMCDINYSFLLFAESENNSLLQSDILAKLNPYFLALVLKYVSENQSDPEYKSPFGEALFKTTETTNLGFGGKSKSERPVPITSAAIIKRFLGLDPGLVRDTVKLLDLKGRFVFLINAYAQSNLMSPDAPELTSIYEKIKTWFSGISRDELIDVLDADFAKFYYRDSMLEVLAPLLGETPSHWNSKKYPFAKGSELVGAEDFIARVFSEAKNVDIAIMQKTFDELSPEEARRLIKALYWVNPDIVSCLFRCLNWQSIVAIIPPEESELQSNLFKDCFRYTLESELEGKNSFLIGGKEYSYEPQKFNLNRIYFGSSVELLLGSREYFSKTSQDQWRKVKSGLIYLLIQEKNLREKNEVTDPEHIKHADEIIKMLPLETLENIFKNVGDSGFKDWVVSVFPLKFRDYKQRSWWNAAWPTPDERIIRWLEEYFHNLPRSSLYENSHDYVLNFYSEPLLSRINDECQLDYSDIDALRRDILRAIFYIEPAYFMKLFGESSKMAFKGNHSRISNIITAENNPEFIAAWINELYAGARVYGGWYVQDNEAFRIETESSFVMVLLLLQDRGAGYREVVKNTFELLGTDVLAFALDMLWQAQREYFTVNKDKVPVNNPLQQIIIITNREKIHAALDVMTNEEAKRDILGILGLGVEEAVLDLQAVALRYEDYLRFSYGLKDKLNSYFEVEALSNLKGFWNDLLGIAEKAYEKSPEELWLRRVIDEIRRVIDDEPDYFQDTHAYAYGRIVNLLRPFCLKYQEENEKLRLMDNYELKFLAEIVGGLDEARATLEALTYFQRKIEYSTEVTLSPLVAGKVVGQLHIITDFSQLQNVKPDEIIVVKNYPGLTNVNMPIPAGIIVTEEGGTMNHAAVRARDWGVPCAVFPLADEFFTGLFTASKGCRGWIVLDVASTETIVRLATDEDIENRENTVIPYRKAEIPIADVSEDKPKIILSDEVDTSILTCDELGSQIGPKAANSAFIGSAPDFLSTTFRFFKEILEENPEVKLKIETFFNELKGYAESELERKISEIETVVRNINIPRSLQEKLFDAIKRQFLDKGINYAIFRTSTNAEDLDDFPGVGAGVYGSYYPIDLRDQEVVIDTLRRCFASMYSKEAFWNRQMHGIDHKSVYPAVMIQEVKKVDYSFVIHTANPVSGETNSMMIELMPGQAESLVSDNPDYQGLPYQFEIARENTDSWNTNVPFIKSTMPTKRVKVMLGLETGDKIIIPIDTYENDPIYIKTDADLARAWAFLMPILQKALETEALFGRPQDIEGGVVLNEDGSIKEIYFWQSRAQ